MSTISPRTGATNPVARQWQFPLLLGSLILFAAGVARLIPKNSPATFENDVHDVRALIEAGNFVAAHERISKELVEADRTEEQRRTLHRLMAETIHSAERVTDKHSAENAERLVASLQAAERLGVKLEAADLVRMADGLDWTGR